MNETNEIVTFLFTLVAGGIMGFIISHFVFASRKQNKQQKEIDANKEELEAYKAKVNNHFTDSAELMGQVANSYQALYNHMADQSQTLLDEDNHSHFPLLKTPVETDLSEDELTADPAIGDVDNIDSEENTESNEKVDEVVINEDDSESVAEQPAETEQTSNDAEQNSETDETKAEDAIEEDSTVKTTEEKK